MLLQFRVLFVLQIWFKLRSSLQIYRQRSDRNGALIDQEGIHRDLISRSTKLLYINLIFGKKLQDNLFETSWRT